MASPRKKKPLKHSSSMSHAKEAELQKAFSLADTDGSGLITEEEFYQMYRNQGVNMTREEASTLFRENDKDKDGFISMEEYFGKETRTEQIWSILDRDRDGVVHRSDAEAAIKKFKKSLSAVVATTILKSFDKEKGGKNEFKDAGMSYDAFCDVMKGLSVEEEGKKNESGSSNKTEAPEKRQRRPSKKRKN